MSHLKEIKSSYLKHLVYSLYFCFLALLVVITGLIHAIFPFVFEFTPYKLTKKIIDGTEQNFNPPKNLH